MLIEEPTVLARLPKSLQENNQQTFGAVYGFSAGSRKRRNEVSVAVDGNSVNIYEIQDGRLRASYAVPPDSYFTSRPTSVRIQHDNHTCSRYTYISTKRKDRVRLDCFEERFENDLPHGVPSQSSLLNGEHSRIVYIDVLPEASVSGKAKSQHILFALHQDGILRQYASGSPQLTLKLREIDEAEQSEVLAARLVTYADGSTASLKHRPDLLASIQSTSSFLFVVYRQGSGADVESQIGIWALPSPFNMEQTVQRSIDAIYMHRFPASHLWSQENGLDCFINPKATSLIVTGAKTVVSFNLSAYKPIPHWEQNVTVGLTSISLNRSFMVTSTATSLTVYDTVFNTARVTLDLARIGKKRKRDGVPGATRGLVKIIGYFPKLKKLITVRRNLLLAFEIKDIPSQSLLIDSVGTGAPGHGKLKPRHEVSKLQNGSVDDLTGLPAHTWTGLQQKMLAAADIGDPSAFEVAVLSVVQGPDSVGALSDQQMDFLISKLFRWNEPDVMHDESQSRGIPHLQIALPAHGILSTLIEYGAITPHAVHQALNSGQGIAKGPPIEPGAIPAALIESDKTLLLLAKYINNNAACNAIEFATVVGLLIKGLVSRLSTDRSNRIGQQAHIWNHHADNNSDSESRMLEIEHDAEVDLHIKPLELTSIRRMLVITLEKFAQYGESVITEGLRSRLDRSEILALVQILRQQLFEGQHTTSAMQGTQISPSALVPSNLEDRISAPVLSLDATSRILLGCINAVGTLGFLADDGGEDFLAKLIPELKSETSLATQGLEEAAYLRGILRETIIYAESLDKDQLIDTTITSTDETIFTEQKPGIITTIYSEPNADQGDSATTSGLLPLSLRAENTFSLVKVRKGGGQVKYRSLRELREMENRNKGVYSFERLVL